MSNRSRARLEFAAQAEDIHENVKRRGKMIKLMENSSKDSKLAEETGSQTIGVDSQGSIKTVENIFQGEIAEDNINQKCSKEVSNNSLQGQKKVPLVKATATEINSNLTPKVPLSSGQILTNFTKCDDARGNILHYKREVEALDEDALSAVISTKVDEQYPQKLSATDSNRVEE